MTRGTEKRKIFTDNKEPISSPIVRVKSKILGTGGEGKWQGWKVANWKCELF